MRGILRPEFHELLGGVDAHRRLRGELLKFDPVYSFLYSFLYRKQKTALLHRKTASVLGLDRKSVV